MPPSDTALPRPVRLYDQPRAPNPRRLNLFLLEKGIEIEREILDLIAGEHRSDRYPELGGFKPTVPALLLSNGRVLTEVPAICRYLEALHPDPNMLGRDALEAAEIEMWHRRVELGLFAAVGQAFRHTNPKMSVMESPQIAAWGEANRARIDDHLAVLDARLRGRDWLAADRMTVADVTGYVAASFQRILHHPIPDGLDALAAWKDRIAARPATQRLEAR